VLGQRFEIGVGRRLLPWSHAATLPSPTSPIVTIYRGGRSRRNGTGFAAV